MPSNLTHSIFAAVIFLLNASSGSAQLTVQSVQPDNADAGDTGVVVTATLGTNGLPPSQVSPTAMTIGSVNGSNLSRDNDEVSATFNFPDTMSPGSYNVSVVFPSPQGSITGTLNGGFAINGELPTSDLPYTIVDTNQTTFYDAAGNSISTPSPGQDFYGQDAQFVGNQPSYTVSGDGLTVYDNHTGLTWVKDPDINGDMSIDVEDKMTAAEALDYPDTLNAESFGGYNDWRLPSIKELYSLMDYSGYTAMSAASSKPYINDSVFDFAYGDEGEGERFIDSQWATTSWYVSTIFDGQQGMFGVNFADGRIKCYPVTVDFYVRCVRGNTSYGANAFVNNGDGTVTDRATGLMWTQNDSGSGLIWEDALAFVEQLNANVHLGYSDWRLPNIKELHSIVDYARSPDTSNSAAIDSIFNTTAITDEGDGTNYPFYWSGTTHVEGNTGDHGCYVAFGEALGFTETPPMSGSYTLMDVHGAGAQRSDPKTGNPNDYPNGFGPQGDVIRIYNFVRAVRDADLTATEMVHGWAMY